MTGPHDRFVTIRYFTTQMLGLKSRQWYYLHINDPGMPQRVMVGNKKAMLSYKDCVAYIERIKNAAKPPAPPKRKRGRPRKMAAAYAA